MNPFSTICRFICSERQRSWSLSDPQDDGCSGDSASDSHMQTGLRVNSVLYSSKASGSKENATHLKPTCYCANKQL